jgi:phosphoglucosamine mutase
MPKKRHETSSSPIHYFGTDGIRGSANHYLTPDLMLRVGQAAGVFFQRGDYRHRVIIGKDTRRSGYMIENALVAGFTSMGMDVFLLGPMPTPALAMLTHSMRCDLGVMISASHNPYEDNGIKLFGPDGFKLSDTVEEQIENLIDSDLTPYLASPALLGKAKRLDDGQARYIEFAKRTVPRSFTLEGLRIVLDCAHGAGYKVAPQIFWELGAEVFPIGIEPDGFNINRNVGSTSPNALAEKVKAVGADLGIALDGDGDRLLIVDEKGDSVDGNHLLGCLAVCKKKEGTLLKETLVTTIMANLGLEHYLLSHGISMLRTAVGDRYVIEQMRAEGCNVGGEPSGHIIFTDHITTGDGIIAALQVLVALQATGQSMSMLTKTFNLMPQILKNIPYNPEKPPCLEHIHKLSEQAQQHLGEKGRLLIRASGTEPVIRIMGEGESHQAVCDVVDNTIEVLKQYITE